MSTTIKATAVAVAAGLGLVALSACGGPVRQGLADSKTVTLVSHDSWAVSKTVLKDFEKRSGYNVTVLKDGDAGEAVNKAILSKDNPQGDVLFGVDNTLLSRALDNGLFEPYEAKGLDQVPPRVPARRGRAPRHPDRLRRHLRQLRQEVLRRSQATPPPRPSTTSSSRVQEPAGHRERVDVVARPRLPARQRRALRRRRLAELLEEAQGQRREGRRRLGAGVQRAASRGPPAARRRAATGRSSCPTRPARRPR